MMNKKEKKSIRNLHNWRVCWMHWSLRQVSDATVREKASDVFDSILANGSMTNYCKIIWVRFSDPVGACFLVHLHHLMYSDSPFSTDSFLLWLAPWLALRRASTPHPSTSGPRSVHWVSECWAMAQCHPSDALFHSYGRLCASHPWEVIVAVLAIFMCISMAPTASSFHSDSPCCNVSNGLLRQLLLQPLLSLSPSCLF